MKCESCPFLESIEEENRELYQRLTYVEERMANGLILDAQTTVNQARIENVPESALDRQETLAYIEKAAKVVGELIKEANQTMDTITKNIDVNKDNYKDALLVCPGGPEHIKSKRWFGKTVLRCVCPGVPEARRQKSTS